MGVIVTALSLHFRYHHPIPHRIADKHAPHTPCRTRTCITVHDPSIVARLREGVEKLDDHEELLQESLEEKESSLFSSNTVSGTGGNRGNRYELDRSAKN